MKSNHIIKNLIVLLVCALILLAITTYMTLEINKVATKLEEAQNELTTTQNELSSVNESLLSYKTNLTTTSETLLLEQEKNKRLQNEIDSMNGIISTLKSEEYKLVYVGNYKLTHYCTEKRSHICGTGAGITATGTQVTAGRTIAVDPSVIPYGTKVYIEGYGWRVAEDCGGAVKGKHIDIAVETHSQAISMGTVNGGVWILVQKTS